VSGRTVERVARVALEPVPAGRPQIVRSMYRALAAGDTLSLLGPSTRTRVKNVVLGAESYPRSQRCRHLGRALARRAAMIGQGAECACRVQDELRASLQQDRRQALHPRSARASCPRRRGSRCRRRRAGGARPADRHRCCLARVPELLGDRARTDSRARGLRRRALRSPLLTTRAGFERVGCPIEGPARRRHSSRSSSQRRDALWTSLGLVDHSFPRPVSARRLLARTAPNAGGRVRSCARRCPCGRRLRCRGRCRR
jgi:hypothetical protein